MDDGDEEQDESGGEGEVFHGVGLAGVDGMRLNDTIMSSSIVLLRPRRTGKLDGNKRRRRRVWVCGLRETRNPLNNHR